MAYQIYRFAVLGEVARADGNVIYDVLDTAENSRLRLYEWTPAPNVASSAMERLAQVGDELADAEVFTSGLRVYLAATESRAKPALDHLRSKGLFIGEWPGVFESKSATTLPHRSPAPAVPAVIKTYDEVAALFAKYADLGTGNHHGRMSTTRSNSPQAIYFPNSNSTTESSPYSAWDKYDIPFADVAPFVTLVHESGESRIYTLNPPSESTSPSNPPISNTTSSYASSLPAAARVATRIPQPRAVPPAAKAAQTKTIAERAPQISSQKKRRGPIVVIAILVLAVVGFIIYYLSGATMRQFRSLIAQGKIVNLNGVCAYSMYLEALQTRGANNSTVAEMQSAALPVLQAKSREVFQLYYQESDTRELSWVEIVRLQDWLNQIEPSQENQALLFYARGMVAMSEKNYELARQLFENALQLKPNWALALNGIGRAYFNVHAFDLARQYYEQATMADPGWKFPYYNLGSLYRDDIKDLDKAEEQFQKAISLDPSRSTFHYILANLYYKKGSRYYGQACDEYRKALNSVSTKTLTQTENSIASQRVTKICPP